MMLAMWFLTTVILVFGYVAYRYGVDRYGIYKVYRSYRRN
jgi:hypothetical protein